jgi:hypothetical protein
MFTAMQSELTRILAPAELNVTWRAIDNHVTDNESFPEIVVLHFRGTCLFAQDVPKGAPAPRSPIPAGLTLADTDLVDGHVLPFGEVQCDELRRFIAPAASALRHDHANALLGRAIARVGAHEIYHMLTGSSLHALSGIARAEHSRKELLAASFAFARPEQQWLRSWAQKLKPPLRTEIATVHSSACKASESMLGHGLSIVPLSSFAGSARECSEPSASH